MKFSLVVNHCPWNPERATALAEMMGRLATSAVPTMCNDVDYRGTDWQKSKVKWALDQWRWSSVQNVTHHVFMTDDLHIAPNFWVILDAMVQHSGKSPIGLLSNHPLGPSLFAGGHHWYKTQSWLVGPAYVLPHDFMVSFLAWFEHLTPELQAYANDDSSINEFVSQHGMHTLHPLPTIIEHRDDIGSTVGHGDRFSRERLSWREVRDWTRPFGWHTAPFQGDMAAMASSDYWRGPPDVKLLPVDQPPEEA